MRKSCIVVLLFCIVIIVGCKTARKRPGIPPPPPPPELPAPARLRLAPEAIIKKLPDSDFPGQAGDPGVLLVKRKRSATEKAVADFHKLHRGKITRFKFIRWESVELPKGQESKLYQEYRQSKLFDLVEFQRIYTSVVLPNDPLLNQQWAWGRIQAPAAWDKTTSNNVIVAVVDTGIDFNHQDLQQNLWTGPQGEHGYTAIGGTIINGGQDDHHHGTHVAGTVAAVGNNNTGVTGVNWRSKLASFKFLNSKASGATRDAILCMEKMIELKNAGQNIRVANHSWGGLQLDLALQDAFLAAENAGILNVCAAGNNGFNTDAIPFYPSTFPLQGIVSILASDQTDLKASFSNFGAVTTDLFAPGVSIFSCKPNNSYQNLSGTSMASPHVAGAMAAVFSLNPTLTPQQARAILLEPASYDRISFTDNSTGGGRLNLTKLWNNPSLSNPPPANLPPVVAPYESLVFVGAGQTVPIGITATDPEGSAISYNYTWDTHQLPSFLRYVMGGAHPYASTNFKGSGSTNVALITGKVLALDQNVKLQFGASDGHGGGEGASISAFTYRDERKISDIDAAIKSFRIWDDTNGHPWFRLDMDTNYPSLETVRFEVKVNGGTNNVNSGGVGVPCCYVPNVDHSAVSDGFGAGAFSVRVIVSDLAGNFTTSPASVYVVSNSTLNPPNLQMTVTTNRGVTPLVVTADMSATQPGSAVKLQYAASLWGEGGISEDVFNPVRQFTLTEPGVYAVIFTVKDVAQTISDTVIKTFTVLPVPPPQLSIKPVGNAVRISWISGILQEANLVTGPWTVSSNQNNPQTRPAVGNRFFRVVSQ